MAAIYTKGLSTHNRQWADLDLDFVNHPITKDIVRKTNVEAVKRAVRNLILTNRYDKAFHPEIDGGVTRHLFGLSTAHTKHDIEITSFSSFNLEYDNDIANVDPQHLLETINNLEHQNADAIFVSCTALRAVEILDQAERDTSKFVISSNQALIWDTIRSVNINSNINGYGKLFLN